MPTSTSWSGAAAPPSAESRTDTSERHRFTQDVGLDVCAQTRRWNDINGSAEYLLNLALQSGDVEKAHCPIEIDEQVDVGFLGVRSFRDTAEDTGVAPSVGSNQAKDELTILGERSAAGCSAVKAQQAGYLRLTASDRGRDCSLAQARLLSGANSRYEHRARAFVQFICFQRLGR